MDRGLSQSKVEDVQCNVFMTGHGKELVYYQTNHFVWWLGIDWNALCARCISLAKNAETLYRRLLLPRITFCNQNPSTAPEQWFHRFVKTNRRQQQPSQVSCRYHVRNGGASEISSTQPSHWPSTTASRFVMDSRDNAASQGLSRRSFTRMADG